MTQAENTARCPWQTFLGRLLRLETPFDALDALPGIEPRLVGSLVHDVLERIVMQRIPTRPTLEEAARAAPTPVPWPDAAELEALLHDRAEALVRAEGIGLPGFARVLAAQARPRLAVARALDWSGPSGAVFALGAELEGEIALEDARVRRACCASARIGWTATTGRFV